MGERAGRWLRKIRCIVLHPITYLRFLRRVRVRSTEQLRWALDNKPYRTIILEEGIYPVVETLVIRKPCIIKGEGRARLKGMATMILLSDFVWMDYMILVEANLVGFSNLEFEMDGAICKLKGSEAIY